MRNTTTYSPKFVSTIAALSLCLSSAVAHHEDNNWEISGNNSNHSGSGSSGSGTTTISNLESGSITTKSDATGTISSLIIEGKTNNDNKPILEVGNGNNKSIVNVPTITIKEGATLNRTIQNGSQGWNIIFRGGSTIGSFENKGTISSGKKAGTVYLLTDGNNNGGQTVVRNFTNNGTIKAIESEDVNAALRLQGAKIETFKNEKGGLISATGGAVAIQIERNGNNGTGYDGSIETFINEGTISAGERAVSLAHATITSFDNQGTIKSEKVGIAIGSQNTTITHLKNSGVIEINGDGAGIALRQLNTEQQKESKPIYDTIENTNTGIITGGDYGIFIEGGTITHLKNSGTIEGKKDGIAFFNAGGKLHTTITNLEIEKGIIRGKENGINISKINGNNDQTVVGNLKIAKGATVEGINGSGLVLGKDNKNGQKDIYKLTGKIEVNGTLKGNTAGIINEGQLGSSANQDVIVIGSNGKIEGGIVNSSNGRKGRNGGSISGNIVNNSNSDLRITNNDKASFKGNITNNGNGTLAIDNQGKTGNNTVIKNNGSGEIKIKDWKLENQDGNGNLKTVQFEGNGNITLEKLTISEGNTDITKVANAIQGSKKAEAVAHTQVQTNGGNGAVTITGDLLRGLVANIDGSKTAAAALNRTLIATATARATFLDTVMGNALNTLSFLHHRASSSLGSYKNANLYANATTVRNDLLSQSSSYA
ncbi:hypothetical protein, partial [Helicobacter sp. 10-6591]|uniref:hypothetical protein n=1 Tax=Helicobacter sp. 10-6591 TaxID=2004998 RepID=UPI000DCD196E